MAVTTPLMTVEEFQKLPIDDGPVYHELRHGELVSVSRPKLKHIQTQKRTERLLEAAVGGVGVVVMEFSFRPQQYELRVADVAYISHDRWERADPNGDFPGAPDMVIEILSPSNTIAELFDKEKLCLENGAQQFWVIDQDRRQIKVSTPDGRTLTYRSGQEIPLPLFGNATVAVDAILG
jgi:Uma2 family endonuclease